MMKKVYTAPAMELCEMEPDDVLLAGSNFDMQVMPDDYDADQADDL